MHSLSRKKSSVLIQGDTVSTDHTGIYPYVYEYEVLLITANQKKNRIEQHNISFSTTFSFTRFLCPTFVS